MRWPKPPTGSSPFAVWCREFLNTCRQSELKSGVGYNVKQSPSGTTLDIFGTNMGGAGSLVDIKMFAITTLIGGDVVIAKSWDGGALGAQVPIAKTPRARTSIVQELIDGDIVTYAQNTTFPYDPTGDNNRIATDSNGAESQVCYPRYVTLGQLGLDTPTYPLNEYAGQQCQALIFACKPSSGTGVVYANGKVVWQELNQRVWALKYGS